MILSHIIAASKNRVIGVNGDLPWDIPEDMKFFREKTKKHIIIMGRKTFESFPGQKALPHRLNIVITRQKNYQPDNTVVVGSIDEAINFAKTKTEEFSEEIFIIGGGEIYKQTLPLVNKVYLTQIHQSFEGDAFYPELHEDEFEIIEQTDRTEPIAFSFLTYERK